ncbi:MAG: 4Fe-4S cluster-binding domain-containing protein [Spirochaetaceae bacterium]|nr:4Fe-4S cluster-binding domain-containing protein [Spirochaetaceae bacterium]
MKKVIKFFIPHGFLLAIRLIRARVIFLRTGGKKPRLAKLQFEVHLTEHCNLKCAGCGPFSALAEEEYAKTSVFENDLRRINNLTNGDVRSIRILGGEPLLNKDINEFMEISRRYFKDTFICIITNVILLDKMDASFWKTAHKNNIWISISPYPIKLNINLIRQLSNKYGVPCGYVTDRAIVDFAGLGASSSRKMNMFRWAIDVKGKQNYKLNFSACWVSNECITLRNGKLYSCGIFPFIEHFNKQFGTKLEVTERDYIDIYKAKNIDEILDFMATPIPFCRHCNLKKVTYGHEWRVTKKEISEWT